MMCQNGWTPLYADEPEGYRIQLWQDIESPHPMNCSAVNFSLYELAMVEKGITQSSDALGQLAAITPKVTSLQADMVSVKAQILVIQEGGGSAVPGSAVFPWNMTAGEGALVGAAILGVWAVAWGFRALITTLHVHHHEEKD